MTRSVAAPLVFAAAIAVLPATAFAGCETQGGLICGSGAPRISSAAELRVSRGGNFKALGSEAGLRGGDRVLTGTSESALALGGSCTTTVKPGSLVSFTRSGGRTCASITNRVGALGPDSGPLTTGAITDDLSLLNPFDLPTPVVAGGLAAGVAGAVGLGVGLSGGNATSPAPTLPGTVSAQ